MTRITQERKTSSTLHYSEPDGRRIWHGRNPCDLTGPRIAPYKNTWKRCQNTVFRCNLKLAQEKGLQFYQTRSHAVFLHNTLHAVCIEKAVRMKTQDELYQKVRLIPRVPRVVLKKRTRSMVCKIHNAKTQDHLGNHRAIRKVTGKSVTTSWITECLKYLFLQPSSRIQHAENKVKRLIEKFENHKHEESFIQDLSQTKKISKFSKESQDLITDINNTEIFGVCENSSKQQCPNCNAYWEKGKSIAVVEEMLNLRGVQRSSTRTTETSPQSLDT